MNTQNPRMPNPAMNPAMNGGVIDLSTLGAKPKPSASSPYIVDVTEATFEAEVMIKSTQVPVIVDLWADWCGPCIQLKKEVFESETFKTFAGPKLVLVRADFPRLKKNQLEKSQQAKNDLMAEKYNQDGKFPLTVLINADGKVLHKWEGFQPNISKFIQEIESSK